MLKNVAIPLMLAASEAEAQRAPSKDEIREALEGDLEEKFAGLQADAAACTVASSVAADNIANLAQAVSDAKTAKEQADVAVTALVAADGAWGLANAAREAAVTAAVEAETAANIAGFLDALDVAAEDERAKAQLFVTANDLYEAGLRAQSAADARVLLADAQLLILQNAATAASDAVTAAKDQSTKESLWRGWRYCELGAAVVGATLTDVTKGYWQMYESAPISAAQPASCVVPAVANDPATGGNAREAVTYYTASGVSPGLPAESEDGTSRWSATVVHTAATAALSAETLQEGYQRTKAGEVAWHTGNLRAAQWTENQRKREQTFYGSVNSARNNAKAVASSMATGTSYDQPGTLVAPFLSNDVDTNLMVASAAGAQKALVTAATARDSNASGSVKNVPAARTQSVVAGSEWQTTWARTTAGLDAWATANSSGPSASALWWAQAKLHAVALNTWWTNWDSSSTELTPGNVAMTETEVQTSGGGSPANASAACRVDASPAGGGTWAANAAADKAACKTACQTAARDALLVNPDTTSPTVDNGGLSMAAFSGGAVTTWCGAYSFETGGTTCRLLSGGNVPVINAADTQGNAADFCAGLTTVTNWTGRQSDVATTWALVTTTLHDNMQTLANTQAGLEKAWLSAWYVQQYWANLLLQLTEDDGTTVGRAVDTHYGAKSKTFKDAVDVLADAQVLTTTSVAGATSAVSTAQTNLNTAAEALATLQATEAAAAAVVAGLGTRITRADAQIVELDGLANTGATGTLDQASALRAADLAAYTAADGEKTLADAAKVAADAAVKARTGAATTDGGALTEAKELAEAAWTAAQGAAGTADGDLTTALAGTALTALRATVVADQGTWDTQQAALVALIQAAENAEDTLDAAEKAKDAAVLACQIAAYDKYRTALEAEMVQRAEDLKTIKALLETELVEPAPGTAGARCEKALSNGTYRPARGETTCAEGLCCGAARVWMESGTTADAGWRTLETCQLETDTSYMYQPPRAPMATASPQRVSVDFACIEGAKKLAAAASAVAAAVYMLA